MMRASRLVARGAGSGRGGAGGVVTEATGATGISGDGVFDADSSGVPLGISVGGFRSVFQPRNNNRAAAIIIIFDFMLNRGWTGRVMLTHGHIIKQERLRSSFRFAAGMLLVPTRDAVAWFQTGGRQSRTL